MKKIQQILILSLVFIGMLVFNSCEKESLITEPFNTNEVQDNVLNNSTSFYIDNEKVQEQGFTKNTSDMFLIEFHKKPDNLKSNGDEPGVEKRAYSSEDKYVAFGEANGLNLGKLLVFEKMMSSYAETSGAIEENEKTGLMPEWYLEREAFVYDSLFNNELGLKSVLTIFTTLYENQYVPGSGAGKCIFMPKQMPFMPPGWNDRVSCVEFVGLGGGIIIFGKSFYRNRLVTIIDWGMTRINLGYGVDNLMRSGIEIF
ncbi:MAG TPA: hypothetical protein VJY41_00215 [Prolixibacteraceae bacterium]|nr:hypothetical protein [Prolixibacteraceae bacterium]